MYRHVRPLARRLRRVDWIVLALAAYSLAAVTFLIAGIGHRDLQAFWVDLLPCLPAVAASVLCVAAARASRSEPRARLAWSLLAAACASYGVGLIAWFVLEGVIGDSPFPSLADAGFLGWYPLALASLFAFPSSVERTAGARRSFVFDGFVLVLGVGLMIWLLVLLPLTGSGPSDIPTVLVSIGFAIGDLLLLVGVLHSDLRARGSLAHGLVLVGMVCILGGDTIFAMAVQKGVAASSGVADIAFLVAWLPIALGARRTVVSRSGRSRRPAGGVDLVGRGFSLLPYGAIAVGVLLLVWVGLRNLESETGAITLSAVAITVIITIRQALVARDNGRELAASKAHHDWDRLVQLIQHGTDVIVLVDAGGVIRYATPSSERLLGLAPDRLLGRLANTVIDPELVRDRMALAMARPLHAPGEPLELPLHLPDGTVKVIELVATRTMDDALATILVVNIRDVTERHAATEAVKRSEAHERALLQALPDQILRFDRSGRFLGASGAPSPGTPFTDDALGKTFFEVLPKTLAQFCMDALTLAFDEGGIHELSYANSRPDGMHQFETRVMAVGEQEGLAIVRDVTRSRAATADLQRLAQILDATPDIVCSFSVAGGIVYANAAFRELLGLPNDGSEVKADSFLSRFPDVRTTFREVAIPTAVAKGFWRGDLDFRSGETDAPISMIVLAHRGPDDTADYISIIGRDISQRRRTEAALKEAKDEADAASLAKGEFLATMSHEIRTPMNGIIGVVELLLGTELSAEQRDLATTLQGSSEALLEIINDVLDFSKIEANSLELETIRFDLPSTIDGVCRILGGAATRKGLQLLVSIDQGVPAALEGDPGRLRQILTNLVGNAVKFTEHGEVVVRVMLGDAASDSRLKLHFEVRDTGIGIAPDVQARLFQSFAQADGSMSRRFGGTGLGLAISRRLVELMGGELGVHSRVGDGSTFWFTASFDCDPAARNGTGDRPLGDFRILVLDDKPTSRGILLGQLAGWGMRAFAESTESEARRALHVARDSGDPFACLIVDDPVAGLSGDEMAARFGIESDLGLTQVIILGGSSRAGRDRSAGARQVTYIAKPVASSDLLDNLVRLLVPASAEAASPAELPSPLPDDPRHGSARILMVEDNEVNRKVAGAILGRLGYRADVASDGFEALHAIESTAYDVVLMDCQMPGMDGFEATRTIRSRETGGRHLPIVALTANATASDRERCLAAGMDDYLAKPVRLETMRAAMSRWLATDQDALPATPPATEEPAAELVGVLDGRAMAAIRELNVPDDDDILAPLVDLFLDQAAGQVAAIAAAVGEGDPEAVGRIAHTLKGAARNVGAALVGNLAAEMERRGKAGSSDEPELLAQLEAALAATRSAFLTERDDYQQTQSSLTDDPGSPAQDRGAAA